MTYLSSWLAGCNAANYLERSKRCREREASGCRGESVPTAAWVALERIYQFEEREAIKAEARGEYGRTSNGG